ncbi:MAG TPA: SpoIID/LytB domain-containing protein [Candidatus Anoxymicrobiaceae bacterium]
MFLLRDMKIWIINFTGDLWEKARHWLPVWGFPALFILFGLIFVTVQIAIADKGPPTPKHSYKPAWSRTVVDESPPVVAQAPATAPATTPTFNFPAQGSATQVQVPETATAGLSSGSAVPSPDAVFVFKCYGRAHGVGLCMDGVRYRAMAGQSAADIISAYYTGVTVSPVDDSQLIRVKGRSGSIYTMSMKDYMYHLSEEPEDFPPEGLKVLYLAARAYTLSVIARHKHTGQGFDICSSGDCCQAFDENKDVSKSPNNKAAVDATSGQGLFYNGEPIIAAYCGSCGGHTDNNEDVWGGAPIPYLRGRNDSYCSKSPRYLTVKEISVRDLQNQLGVGSLKLVDLSNRTPGGRVKTAKIVSASGEKSISGTTLATMLGFRGNRYEYTFR